MYIIEQHEMLIMFNNDYTKVIHWLRVYFTCKFFFFVHCRARIIEEDRYMGEKEGIRQRSADRYIVCTLFLTFCRLQLKKLNDHEWLVTEH